MAKKKATMTLKDFHGGSIPSDLPLPSAPGVIVRPSDRVGFDRSTVWGNPMGRSDHRLRPGSAGAIRNFDDKTPFLTHATHIGRNFDEDERTPLDGASGPRRTVSDENIHVPVLGSEPKLDYIAPNSRPVSNPSSYAARFAEGVNTQSRMNYQNVGGSSGHPVVGPSPNAWTVRKDVVVQDQVPVSWSVPDAATKLAHASALEKVSSGRWHSKQLSDNQVDIEVIKHPETHIGAHFKGYGMSNRHIHENLDLPVRRESHEAILVRQAEKSLIVDDGICAGSTELPVYDRVEMPVYAEAKAMNHRIYDDDYQPSRDVGKYVTSELQLPLPLESSERPKLNLLHRSRPLENVEAPPANYNQSYQKSRDPVHDTRGSETYERVNTFKPEPETGGRVRDRPILNLKPRFQPHDQLEGSMEVKRNTLFGGARPRELVLKERGIDDVAVNNYDPVHPSNRTKQDVVPRGEVPVRHNGKTENAPLDRRIGKNIDRRDHRGDAEKSDTQRKNWRSENRRSGRDLEKQQSQKERPPSPETWRKPIEHPASPTGLRYGKAASAVELAQAFSKSVSDPKAAERLSGQRGLPGRGQVPFSRLTGTQSRPNHQINGY